MLRKVIEKQYYMNVLTSNIVFVYTTYPKLAFVNRPYRTVRWCFMEEVNEGTDYRYYHPFNDTSEKVFKMHHRELNRIERALYL